VVGKGGNEPRNLPETAAKKKECPGLERVLKSEEKRSCGVKVASGEAQKQKNPIRKNSKH